MRDAELILLETSLRQAIREAVNRSSRKPFLWGGLAGYQQLVAIGQALQGIADPEPETAYLHVLRQRVERVLTKVDKAAADLRAAHDVLVQIARALHYPPKPDPAPQALPVTSQTVRQAIDTILTNFQPNGAVQWAQRGLHSALKKRWERYAADLLACYDLPGLPPDNLQLEGLFGRLRRQQRRISGRKSTRELQDFGQVQVLFQAPSQADLFHQLQCVPYAEFLRHRQRLAQVEFPRTFFRRLHHDPLSTIQSLLSRHADCRNHIHRLQSPHRLHHIN